MGWLAYQSSESGQAEVYLTRFPNTGAKYQVSLEGGIQPVWSKDGKRLHYVDAGQRLIAADIRTEKDSVQVGARRTLFQTSVQHPLMKRPTTSTRGPLPDDGLRHRHTLAPDPGYKLGGRVEKMSFAPGGKTPGPYEIIAAQGRAQLRRCIRVRVTSCCGRNGGGRPLAGNFPNWPDT
jgi:hypothetical protein